MVILDEIRGQVGVGSSTRSVAIDCLRAISILWVMEYHFVPLRILNHGMYGVLLFFVISGYCIAISAENSNSAWHFYAKRLGRLLPSLIVCGAVTTAAKHAFPHLIDADRINSWFDYFYCLFALPTLGALQLHYHFPDGAYWSLVAEFQFYVICFVAMFIGNRDRLISFVSAVAVLHSLRSGLTTNGANDFFVFFIAGLSIAAIERGRLAEGFAGLFIAIGLDLYHLIFHFLQPNIPIGFGRTIFLWFAIALVWFASSIHLSRSLQRMLAPLAFIGLISYPLYLFHQDIGYMIIKAVGAGDDGIGILIRGVLVPGFLIFVAWLIYFLVERNAIKPLTALLSGKNVFRVADQKGGQLVAVKS
jgi:peptidoglycan/LPS O-acetylase OafA/YrhL